MWHGQRWSLRLLRQFFPLEPEQSAHSLLSFQLFIAISQSELAAGATCLQCHGNINSRQRLRRKEYLTDLTWLKKTSKNKRQRFTLGFIMIWISKVNADSVLLSGSRCHGYQGWMPQNGFGYVSALRSCTLDHHFLPNAFQNCRQCLRIFEWTHCFGYLHDLNLFVSGSSLYDIWVICVTSPMRMNNLLHIAALCLHFSSSVSHFRSHCQYFLASPESPKQSSNLLHLLFVGRSFVVYSWDGRLQRDATSQIGGLKIIGIQAGWCGTVRLKYHDTLGRAFVSY